MMEAVFDIKKIGTDIQMCSVPVPSINSHKASDDVVFTTSQINNYGQSQTHPSIEYRSGGFGGHQWWMATTPYPKATGVFENVCVYYADTNADGTPPTVFTPINGVASGNYAVVSNPIVKVKSTGDINSDPDIIIDDELGKMYIISRDNIFMGHAAFLQESTNGQSWTERPYRDESKVIASNSLSPFLGCPELISPSLVKINGVYKYIAVTGTSGIYNKNDLKNQGRFWGLYMGESTSLKQSNDCFSYIGKSGVLSRQIEIWHADCFEDKGNIYIIGCAHQYANFDKNYQRGIWLGVSKDGGKNFSMYPRPLFKGNFYRPTAAIDSNRNIVIYGCFESGAPTSASSYPNGTSDVPIDGRAIFMAYKNFDELIKVLELPL